MTVTLLDLVVRELRIPFKVTFRHASAERSETSSLWAEARTAGATGYGESCPRPYVTGESIGTARAFVMRHEPSLRRQVVDVETLRHWMAARRDEIDGNPAAWCALELAILDVLAKERGVSVEDVLDLPPLAGAFRYSAVIGDSPLEAFTALAERYRQYGFTDFKIKLSGDLDRDRDKLAVLRQWGLPSLRVRVDANNLWDRADTAIRFLEALDYQLFAVEEPIAANQYADLAHISQALGCRVVLDESVLRVQQLGELAAAPAARWLINVRVSKMGGLLRSLDVVGAASTAGIGIIVGAQVGETSLLTRVGLTVAQAAGTSLVAQEGAFGTLLLEHDIVEPLLMFGAGGILEPGASLAGRPGFGLAVGG